MDTMGGMELLAIAEEIDSAASVLDMTDKAFKVISESNALTGEETVLEISCGTGLFGFRLLEAKLAKKIALADSEKYLAKSPCLKYYRSPPYPIDPIIYSDFFLPSPPNSDIADFHSHFFSFSPAVWSVSC